MKKIISLILACTFLLCTANVFAFNDVDTSNSFSASVDRLSRLGIINGYSDQSFRPNETLTRAQFAKIATIMQGKKDAAVLSGVASQFSDVTSYHWASGYIGLVAQSNLISGYGDGSFRPENNITYAEAITIIIRMLGYSAEDVGYNWPTGYLEKAKALSLIDNFYFGPYAYITRGEASVLLDKALFIDKKDSTTKLVYNLNLTEVEDAVIIATQSVDSSLAGDVVSTSSGTYKKGTFNMDALIGKKVDILIDNETNEICYVSELQLSCTVATVEKIVDKDISVKIGGVSQTIQIDDNVAVYSKGSKSTMNTKRATLEEGSELYLYSENSAIDYVFLYEYDILGPVTVKSSGEELINTFGIENRNTLTVVRAGYSSTLNEIERFDIAYYNKGTNTIYTYDDRVTGIYEEAYPLKSNVTSVLLSGTKYELESNQAMKMLGESSGSFKIDDKVTLLLGSDDRVADAVVLDSVDVSDYGVIISTRTATSTDDKTKGELIYYTTIITGSGNTVELKSDKSYSSYVSQFMSIDYSEGKAILTKISLNPISGDIDRAALSIGGYSLAQNYTILELVKNPSDGTPTIRKIDLADISQNYLSSSDVLHAQFANDFNDILVLYVSNVTNSAYDYGILTLSSVKDSSSSISSTYEIMADGVITTYKLSDKAFSSYAGMPVGVNIENNSIESMYSLPCVATNIPITAISSDRIKSKDTVYKMADDVQIYQETSVATYTQLSISDLEKSGKTVYLYADKHISNGGIIRVIVVK